MSDVFFASARLEKNKDNILKKTAAVYDNLVGQKPFCKKGDLVGVKLHFGEYGNTAYVRPNLVRVIIDKVRGEGAKPFLVDTNALYKGSRTDSVDHIQTALMNGFTHEAVNAPIIIGDGLRGTSFVEVKPGLQRVETAWIASEIYHADAIVAVTHVKGHCLFGFGGAIKNIGMGIAARRGKMALHSDAIPKVDATKCVACGACVELCPVQAITLNEKLAVMSSDRCIGCGHCIAVCRVEAVSVEWNQQAQTVMEKTVEYCSALVQKQKDTMIYFNFLIDVSPDCDCFGKNETPIVPNIGVLGSSDPVALDAASIDLVNAQHGIHGSILQQSLQPGEDKFREIYPNTDYRYILEYAEQVGLGSRKYELREL